MIRIAIIRVSLTLVSLTLVSLILVPNVAMSSIRFGSNNSGINLLDNATLDVVNSFTNKEGAIRQRSSSSILGDTIFFDLGTFEKNLSPVTITGKYHPDVSGTGTIELNGTTAAPHVFRAAPGTQVDFLQIKGSQNRVEGFPLFKRPIELFDASTTVTLAIKSILNQNIELNGGRIILEENLILADGVSLTGPGTILLNARRLEFGTQDLEVTTPLYWIGAADVYLSGKIDLKSSWTFDKDCYFNGDSTILKLSDGGSLTIRNNSSLRIRELKISGLGNGPGEGRIYFEDPGTFNISPPDTFSSSKLYLRRAALELTSTYTVSQGHIIAEIGSNQFITRDKNFYFERPAHLTVDGINLFYKTRTFADNKNIRPISPPYNDAASPIELLQQGDIIHYRTFQTSQSFFSSYQDGKLNQNVYLGAGTPVIIESGTPTIDGQGWYYHFARQSTKLMQLNSVFEGGLTNIVLKDFNPQHVELPTGASLIFKDRVTIELGNDITFGTVQSTAITWTFQGTCTLDGRGKVMSLQKGGILVQDLSGAPSTLTIQDVVIDGIEDGAIQIDGCQSKIIFKDVTLKLAEDFSFSKGFFEVDGMVRIFSAVDGTQVRFIYDTDCTTSSIINTASTLHFDRNVTLSYAPLSPYNTLLELTDKSSVMSLNGATLFATTTGLQLTKGTLLVDYLCLLSSDATTLAEAIAFGDGVSVSNDLNVDIMPGGKLDIESGYLNYKNIES